MEGDALMHLPQFIYIYTWDTESLSDILFDQEFFCSEMLYNRGNLMSKLNTEYVCILFSNLK